MDMKLSLFVCLLGLTFSVSAEEEWQLNWTPYLWAANMSVDIDFGAGPISTDLDFDDIVDKLEAGFMHYLEFKKGRWGIANEIIYLNIADSKDGPIAGFAEADVDLKQHVIDLVGTYYAGADENTMIYGGVRYINLDLEIETTSNLTPLNQELDGGNDWTNLVVGVRQTVPINDQWRFIAKGDIASDFGDELSSVITLGARYDVSELLDIKFGYRYALIEYEDSDFEFDQTIEGVFAGLGFNW
ncbi:MAG: hypothetical protein GY785_11225 [Gammaproteobacteria bacterium]|nr:hypothetical protein [Gammaproteobacteria bacterium]